MTRTTTGVPTMDVIGGRAERPRRTLLPLVAQVTKYGGTADGVEAVLVDIRGFVDSIDC